jgi:hypothetical protein
MFCDSAVWLYICMKWKNCGISSVSPLCCYVYLENIGFVYPAMSMVVIGPLLLY